MSTRPEHTGGNLKKVSLIVATGPQGEIGLNGNLLWHLPGDLAYFKRHTIGHPIVMGRRTFESIGRALPGRVSVVISRDADFIQKVNQTEYCRGVKSLEAALEYVSTLDDSFLTHPGEPFIVGGGQIYRESLEKNLVGEILLTRVEQPHQADTFFPLELLSGWKEISREPHPADGQTPAFAYLRLIPDTPEK